MCEAYQLTFCVFADKVVLGAAVFIIPLEQETTLRCFRGLVIQNYAHFLTARWLVPVPVPATNKMHKFRLYINFLSFFCLTADRDRWLFLLTPMSNLQSPITNLIKLHVFGLQRNLWYLKRMDSDITRACKLHWWMLDSNTGPTYCVAAMLTTTPPCCPELKQCVIYFYLNPKFLQRTLDIPSLPHKHHLIQYFFWVIIEYSLFPLPSAAHCLGGHSYCFHRCSLNIYTDEKYISKQRGKTWT